MVDVFLLKKAYNGEYYAENEKQVIDFVHRNYGYVVNIERVKNKTINIKVRNVGRLLLR